MRNFIIFFMSNTGSSAIISHLKQLKDKVDIIGFEPFDNCHMKKHLVGDDLTKIFNYLYNKNFDNSTAIKELNKIYINYSGKELASYDNTKSVGCKMRFREFDALEKPIIDNNVTVFILIRRDVFRWAISWYDNKSTQFKLIKGEINKDPQIKVDIDTFKPILARCEKYLEDRYELIKTLKNKGVNVVPIYYEDYCTNKKRFFREFLKCIDIVLPEEELNAFAFSPNYFKKVHGFNLETYITNYDDLKREFAAKYHF